MDLMFRRINPYFIITMTVITSTLVLWLPFLLKWSGIGHLKLLAPLSMYDLYKHWDGVLYVVVAKTFYNVHDSVLIARPLGLPIPYFAAHFPLYPLLIKLLSPLGYLRGMLILPVMFAIGYGLIFYKLVKEKKLSAKPLVLTLVALFVTPRFFVVRSAPAPETLFMFLVLGSVYFFLEEKYWLASILGALAVVTRSPGMLLFVGYVLFFAEKFLKERKFSFNWLAILLLPLGLLLVFGLYYFQMGDFWAYFHSGDNIHLLFPPFQVFNQFARWVGTGWLEDILFVYFFYLLALLNLAKMPKLRPVFWFVLVYFLAIISVEHKDIARYSLPILPFALIAFEKFFTSRKVILAGMLLIPALYFYAWNFLLHNVAPVTDWSYFR